MIYSFNLPHILIVFIFYCPPRGVSFLFQSELFLFFFFLFLSRGENIFCERKECFVVKLWAKKISQKIRETVNKFSQIFVPLGGYFSTQIVFSRCFSVGLRTYALPYKSRACFPVKNGDYTVLLIVCNKTGEQSLW